MDEVTPIGIESVRQIVDGQTALTFKWGRARVLVDHVTANLLVKVYEAASEKTQKTIDKCIAKSKGHFCKVVEIAWGAVK